MPGPSGERLLQPTRSRRWLSREELIPYSLMNQSGELPFSLASPALKLKSKDKVSDSQAAEESLSQAQSRPELDTKDASVASGVQIPIPQHVASSTGKKLLRPTSSCYYFQEKPREIEVLQDPQTLSTRGQPSSVALEDLGKEAAGVDKKSTCLERCHQIDSSQSVKNYVFASKRKAVTDPFKSTQGETASRDQSESSGPHMQQTNAHGLDSPTSETSHSSEGQSNALQAGHEEAGTPKIDHSKAFHHSQRHYPSPPFTSTRKKSPPAGPCTTGGIGLGLYSPQKVEHTFVFPEQPLSPPEDSSEAVLAGVFSPRLSQKGKSEHFSEKDKTEPEKKKRKSNRNKIH